MSSDAPDSDKTVTSESAPSTEGTTTTSSATASPSTQPKEKIDILLKNAGDAPIMKKKKWAVERTKQIAWIIEFIRKYIRCQPNESLFLYVNQSFAPAPDVEVGTLYECFGSDGKLVLHYCKSEAWG